jgi:O-antigen/teichoic acid export membrane protein
MPSTSDSIATRQTRPAAPLAPAAGAAAPAEAQATGRLARSSAVMVALTLLASVTNYGSNLIFGRLLTPGSFGDLTALLALGLIVATPTTAAQTVMAERVAAHNARGDEGKLRYLIRHASAHVMVISLAVGAVYALAIPLVISAFSLQAPGPAIALLPLIVLSYFWPYALGILQGFDRFAAYGGLLLGAAVMRIAFGVPWVLAGGGAGGAIAGQALGIVVGLIFVARILRPWHLRRGTGAATSGLKRRVNSRTFNATMAFVGFAVLSNLDILMAKLWLSGHESGLYAALATIEKVVYFLPGAVAVVMVPAASRARVSEGSSMRVLRFSALLVFAATLIVALPAIVAPHLVLETMFGSKYNAAVGGVLPITIAGAGLAMVNLLVTYVVAMRYTRWVWLLAVGVVLQAATMSLWHSSPVQIAAVQASVVCAILVVNEILFHPLLRFGRWTSG